MARSLPVVVALFALLLLPRCTLAAPAVPAPPPRPGPGDAAPADGPDRVIIGRWIDPSGAIVEFRADGTGLNRRGVFRYTARDGALTFNDGTAAVELAYGVESDRLVVEAQGQSVTFVRADANASPAPRSAPARSVVVNGTALTEAQVARLEQVVHVRVLSGAYWYDRTSGAWGLQGGPTLGFLPAGLAIGGPLRADASGGGTSVFVNGRELHPFDVAALQRITIVLPGRYWVDAMGHCGYEGNPAPFMNLAQLAAAASARSGGAYHARSDMTGIGSGGDGRTSYVMGKDWSVIIGE